jgi:hypothetical protein
MAHPLDIIDRMEQLKREYETLITISVEDTAADFKKMNTEQMYEGVLNNGEPIQPEYAVSTIARKKSKGQPYDRVTLRDKGDFYRGYHLQVINGELVEDSNVQYAPDLEKKYTPKIYGLNEENHETYVNFYLEPDLQKRVSDLTGLQHK